MGMTSRKMKTTMTQRPSTGMTDPMPGKARRRMSRLSPSSPGNCATARLSVTMWKWTSRRTTKRTVKRIPKRPKRRQTSRPTLKARPTRTPRLKRTLRPKRTPRLKRTPKLRRRMR
jgi:hypothetical protein